MEIWFWILGWFLSILAITGNGIITILVSTKRQLRTKTNAFIVSLAVADFLVGASVVPSMFICEIIKNGCNSPRFHMSWGHLVRWLFSYASVMNLCSLILDRYIAVVKPLKYETLVTGRRVMQMIFFSWTIPVGFVISLLVLLQIYITPEISDTFSVAFSMCLEIVSCCMLIFCFVSMVFVIYKHEHSAAILAKQLRFNHRVVTFNTRDKSSVAMMTIVVGLFLICYGMYLRCTFVYIFNLKSRCYDSEYKIPMLVLNSAVNPWAYAFFKRDIKKEIKRLVCKVVLEKDTKVNPVNETTSFTVGNSTL